MANSDKNILIKPNIGSSDSAPQIEFVGADASHGTDRTILLTATSSDSGTISFTNPSGKQVFSLNNSTAGVIFSVNKFDDSSTPLIEVTEGGMTGGLIQLARYKGQVIIGGDSAQTGGAIQDSDDFLVVHKNIRLLNSGQFIGSGAGLTSLPAANLTGTLPALNGNALTSINASNITGTINASQLGGVSSGNYLRSNTSDNFTSGTLEFQDNTMLAFGTSSDTIIEHDTGLNPDGTRFYANQSTGGMLFQDGSTTCFDVAYTAANTTTFFQTVDFQSGSTVDFTGATVTGLSTGGGGGGSGSGIEGGVFLEYEKTVDSDYTIDSDGNGRGIYVLSAADDSDGLTIATGKTVTINSGSSWVLSGGDKNMGLDAMVATSNQTERTMRTGTIKPTLNNTYDLGDSAVAWRNIYTNDLNLSNIKSSGNEIDGTTGKWTIQEGEDDLFIINRRTGKKYKFMLEEVV